MIFYEDFIEKEVHHWQTSKFLRLFVVLRVDIESTPTKYRKSLVYCSHLPSIKSFASRVNGKISLRSMYSKANLRLSAMN